MQATSTIAPASVPGSERQVIFCEAGRQRRGRHCHAFSDAMANITTANDSGRIDFMPAPASAF
jgi:hypothetical protein